MNKVSFFLRAILIKYIYHSIYRIAELIKMKSKKRIQINKLRAEALAKGDTKLLKKTKGGGIIPPKEPTLPVVINDPPAPTYAHMGVPPPYGSRPGSPNIGVLSRPGTPGYPSRTGTPVYRPGTPSSRPGTPGYGQVNPYGLPNGQQPAPVLSRRNSGSSVMSGMTNVSAYTTSYGPGGNRPYGPPNRSQTPPTIQSKRDNLIARAVLNNTEKQNSTPSEKSDDDDRYSEYGGSQFSLGDNTGSKPLLNKYNEYDLYRAPSPARSYSPTPSVSSTTSNPRSRPPNGPHGAYPLRYQQDHRPPRYNNYAQQGGGPNRN
ncbi:hypothetical protein C1645_272467 [Glomus cerebriforme]|uniref:Uncharacterized protein n=1 Tax=Glomus cerebriforme TaxID=658196 RepID=A0A397SS08_9GLOM|nr:hypothetical protein C1645_272467 [Glomus cerebriforme]